MADIITNCETYKDGATIKYYKVYYTLDSGEKFVIYVDADEMTDPSDQTELKTKANTKATGAKSSREATAHTKSTSSNLDGTVTL